MFRATMVVEVRGKSADITKQYLQQALEEKMRVVKIVSLELEEIAQRDT